MKSYLTEFVGTFFLVFTAGLVIASQDPFSALAIGTMYMALVYAGAKVSGGHYNPAVSLASWLAGRMDMVEALKYMVIQLVGAITAALVCMVILDGTYQLAPNPDQGSLAALLVEFLFTFALAYVVLNVIPEDAIACTAYHGLAIGFTLFVGLTAGGMISGGAFNPAMGLGPMVVDTLLGNGSFANAWLYLLGPLAGGGAAAFAYKAQH